MKKKIFLIILLISFFSFKQVYAETINTHSTQNHTKEEITNRYNASKSKYNYSNSIYKDNPNTSIPYYEGSLKPEVEADVLNHLNFYRWLAGLNELSIKTERQSANQKGALILAVNRSLTHYPPKPNGMDEAFYQEGYSACGSKTNTWQGNIANGYRIDYTPETFITDNTNVQPDVAHRSSLLNPNAKQVSFGSVNKYTTMSIHYDNNNVNPDSFNPWPSAGYFPIEAMDQDANTRWSVYLGNYQMTSTTKVTLTYLNNNYVIDRNNLYFTNYSKNMFYNLPTDLRNLITNKNMFKPGVTISVKIENLLKSGVNYTIAYNTYFFTTNETFAESVKLDKDNITLQVGDEGDFFQTVLPSSTTNKNVTWTSSNPEIATVFLGRVTGISEGTATITVTTSNGKTATGTVTVVPKTEDNTKKPVYRLYNPKNGEHLYTTDAYEVSVIFRNYGWGKEGIGWYTASSGKPVYRLYNPKFNNHLYTSDRNEINIITENYGWVFDFDKQPVMYSKGDTPIYRLYNPSLNDQHHLTTDLNEYQIIPKWGWRQEGVAMNAAQIGVPEITHYYK